ncbi:MAG: hypothetical protein WBE44_12030 [Terriglobales bacterium]|jgi:hypothetical protein
MANRQLTRWMIIVSTILLIVCAITAIDSGASSRKLVDLIDWKTPGVN